MMRRFRLLLLMFVLLGLFIHPAEVQAIPSLPSSFYGTVKVNNANVEDGTPVEALINDQVVAQGYTQTYQGDSVYSMDVRGDDTDTTVLDGGREGDIISFKVGGLKADQTASWHSGTNVSLNLSLTSDASLNPPQLTPGAIVTQTPISYGDSTQISIERTSASATLTALSSTTSESGRQNLTIKIVVGAAIMISLFAIGVWFFRRK